MKFFIFTLMLWSAFGLFCCMMYSLIKTNIPEMKPIDYLVGTFFILIGLGMALLVQLNINEHFNP